MKDAAKTKAQLLDELAALRARLSQIEKGESPRVELTLRLSNLGKELSALSSSHEIALATARAARDLLGWDACFVMFYSSEEHKAYPLLTMDTTDDGVCREFAESYTRPGEPGPIFLHVLRKGSLLIKHREGAQIPANLQSFGNVERRAASLMFVPIREKGQHIGMFTIQSYTPGAYDEKALGVLEILADYCASAMERAHAEEALRDREERYRRTIAQAEAVPYERDLRTGEFDYVGEGIRKLTGFSPEEFTSKCWTDMLLEVVPAGSMAGLPVKECMERVLSGKSHSWQADYRIRARDGSERWLADSSIAVLDESGKVRGSTGILQDITERTRASAMTRAFSKLGLKLSAAVTPQEVAQIVADAADTLVGWDACFLNLYSEETDTAFSLINIDTVDGKRGHFPSLYDQPRKPSATLTRTLKEGPQLILRSEADDKASLQLVTFGKNDRRSASLMFVPIRERGRKNIGALSIQSYTRNAYTQSDLDVLQILADHCSGAIERTFAEQKLRESERRNAVFSTLAHSLNSVSTPKEAGAIIADAAQTLLGWDAFIFSLHPAGRDVMYNIVNIDTVDGKKIEFAPTATAEKLTPLARRAIHDGGFLILREPEELKAPATVGHTVAFGDTSRKSASILYAPARKGDEVVGLLSVQSYTVRAYNDESLATLQALADHSAGALERILAQDSLQEERRRIALFAELGRKLGAAASPREAGDIIADATQTLIGWDAFDISLYAPKEDLTYDVLSIDTVGGKKVEFPPIYGGKRLSVVGRRTVVEGAFLLLRDAETIKASLPPEPTITFGDTNRISASLLFVPARKGKDVVAILSAQSYTLNAYDEENLATFQALADHCAGALERIRIHESLQKERLRLAILAELGRKLSAATTPHEAGQTVVEAADSLIGWDSCFLHLYSPQTNIITPVFNMDVVDGRRVEVSIRNLGGPPTGFRKKTLEEGKLLILRTRDEERSASGLTFGDRERRSASLLFVPLTHHNQSVGVLSIQSYRFDAYTTEDLNLLESLAQHCSGALQRMQAVEAMRESEERYALAARGANDGIWDWNLVADIVYFSERWKAIIGYNEGEIGDRAEEWFSRVHPKDLPAMKEELRSHLDGMTDHFQHEHRIMNRDGAYQWVLCRGVTVRNAEGRAVRIAGSMTDVTKRRAAEEELARAAFHDALTGLPNRALFTDRLERCLARRKRNPNQKFAVLFIDLDRFKLVNDSLGHVVGDGLLKQVAERLLKSVREGDTVARLGGDEFTILLDDLHDAGEAVHVAERLLTEIAAPFQVAGSEIFSGASVGVTICSPNYERTDEILRDADTALYRAKESGRGRYVVFDQKMHESVLETLDLEKGLRGALKKKELQLHYQPILSLRTGRACGFEALLRWESPERGPMSAGSFIAAAEDSGVIIPIGEWVVREACLQLKDWRARFPNWGDRFVSVNISARQFASPALGPLVENLLSEHGIDPASLHIEITESAVLKEPLHVRPVLERWRALGIRILLDDFGTNYSPLGRLLNFPVDYLKIDRSFVSSMETATESQHVVRAVISLARILRLSVIAEGAETESQMNTLRDLECEYVQGFYISKPLKAADAEAFLK